MAEKFDAIIIGAGQAGPFLAARLTDVGQTVALIERKLIGGTCVNYGCFPSRATVAIDGPAARASWFARLSEVVAARGGGA